MVQLLGEDVRATVMFEDLSCGRAEYIENVPEDSRITFLAGADIEHPELFPGAFAGVDRNCAR